MNKKLNTILFILGATLFNVIVAVLGFVVFTIIYARFFAPHISEASQAWGLSIIFLAAIVMSFILYRFALKYLMAKIDMDKYFDPIFSKKHIKKN